MSKKTKRSNVRNTNKNRKNVRRIKSVKRHVYKKKHRILTLPGSKGLSVFGLSEKNQTKQTKIILHPHKVSGNMIMGMRNM